MILPDVNTLLYAVGAALAIVPLVLVHKYFGAY
jgi:hypothetical protein